MILSSALAFYKKIKHDKLNLLRMTSTAPPSPLFRERPNQTMVPAQPFRLSPQDECVSPLIRPETYDRSIRALSHTPVGIGAQAVELRFLPRDRNEDVEEVWSMIEKGLTKLSYSFFLFLRGIDRIWMDLFGSI